MRIFLTLILVLVTSQIIAQDWKTFTIQDFGEPFGGWWGAHDGANKGFNINPNDNSIWMLRGDYMTNISADGSFSRVDLTNHSELPVGDYEDFAFVGNNVYLLDAWSGLYRYNGSSWGVQQSVAWGRDMWVDNDTIWIGFSSQNNAATFAPSGVFQFQQYFADRVRRKNGTTWYWTGGNIVYRYYSGSFGVPHVADTSLRLDNSLNDFKFSPFSDSLYLAGDLGISIANSTHFVDSINQYNTVNMPTGAVDQFEFDQNGNIWALFSDGSDQTDLGFLDRTSMEWTTIYDETNSPIAFPLKAALELDAFGNVWIAVSNKLHCLTIGADTFDWLNVNEAEFSSVKIFPNPSKGKVTISFDPSVSIETIEITDNSGRVLESIPFTETIDLNLSAGSYYLIFKNKDTVNAIRKHIIH